MRWQVAHANFRGVPRLQKREQHVEKLRQLGQDEPVKLERRTADGAVVVHGRRSGGGAAVGYAPAGHERVALTDKGDSWEKRCLTMRGATIGHASRPAPDGSNRGAEGFRRTANWARLGSGTYSSSVRCAEFET